MIKSQVSSISILFATKVIVVEGVDLLLFAC